MTHLTIAKFSDLIFLFIKKQTLQPFKKGNYLKWLNKIPGLILLVMATFFSFNSGAQSPIPNEAEWTGGGYALKKIVSNTSIQSGVNFSYTIMFSAPAGATNITITDAIPSQLVVVNVPAPAAVNGVTPTVSVSGTPEVNEVVSYSLTGLPSGSASSGSFTIVVKFPEGTTCDGESARNKACMLVNDKEECTPYVSTTAIAADPWKVNKSIIEGAVVNPSGGSCGYMIAPDATVKYRLYVMKNSPYWGNVSGQMNMNGAVVTDVLPAGAVVTSSTCSGISVGASGTLTWNVNSGGGGLLDAANPYEYYYCEIEVHYPVASFPTGSIIYNELSLDGTICNQPASHTSNQTCVEVVNYTPNPNANFQKYISLANRVPGCTGIYQIIFCNNGNVPLTAFDINDAIPSGVSVDKINIYNANATTTVDLNLNGSSYASGITSTYTTGTITTPSTVNTIQMQMTGSLPVGDCVYMYVYFTIESNPTGTVVTNCASFDGLANSLTLSDACVSFTVEEGAPKPCLIKDICSPQASYDPGDIIRYRIRVQNIGSADITGASFTDILHSNFTYVGNESYYMANNYNPACSSGGGIPSGATAWTGVNPVHSGNNLSWALPDIPSDCQLFYSSYCGTYGTSALPYYFIEFDVMVDSLALPGVTPNNYEISGGNLSSTVTSNTVNVLVVASFGQEVEKQVSIDGGSSFTSVGTVTPGSNARFRLNYKNTSNVPVNNVNLVDLLPLDAGSSDLLILDRASNRGSAFGVTHNGGHSSTISPSGTPPPSTLSYSNAINACLPIFGYSPGGCAGPGWSASPPGQNIKVDYSTYSLSPNVTIREDFDVTIPANAQMQQTACNDFAAISTADFLLDGSPQSITLTPIAAPPVCITVDSITNSSCCDSIRIERVDNPAVPDGCCFQLTTGCEVDSVRIDISNGTFASAIWNCGNLPSGYAGQSSFTFDAEMCAVDMTSCVEPDSTGVVTVNVMIYLPDGEVCEKSIQLDCIAQEPQCCENIKVDVFQDPDLEGECCAQFVSECETDSVVVNISNGTFASATLNGTSLSSGFTGHSSFTFDTNSTSANLITCVTPDSTGVVVVSYIIYLSNGEKCEKRVEMDCKAQEPQCCENIKVEVFQDPDLEGECCAQFVSECETDSVVVNISNGTFASATLNGTSLSSGFTGQSSFTFDTNSTSANLITCVTPDSTGVVVVSYIIYLSNGEKCEKRVEMDCKAQEPQCCENIKVEVFQDPDLEGECCAQFVSECETDSVVVNISNGTFASATLNGTSLSSGFTGQSSFTFDTNSTSANLITCVTPDSTGVVVVSYIIYLSNGEKCEKRVEMDCKAQEPTSECCPIVDFKLRRKWPYFSNYEGTFEITNPDPSNPICSVEISASPSGTFNTGVLTIDGSPSGQSWTSTSIPATGTLSPQAVNEMVFSLIANNYKGKISVCITKCDGSECCYEFNWNGKPIIVLPWEPAQLDPGNKIIAVSVSPEMDETLDEKIKYVSFGFINEDDINSDAEFFAIGGAGDCDDGRAEPKPGEVDPLDPDDDDDGISTVTEAHMSRHSAFFELVCPYSPGTDKAPVFNLVIKGGLPELGMALISEQGNVIFNGEINLNNPDSVISSAVNFGEVSSKMFEFINLYPNPSDGDFTIKYATGQAMDIEIIVVNQLGQILKVQKQGTVNAGVHDAIIDVRDLPAGMYKTVLKSGKKLLSKSAVIK